ncbi:inovirus-type Gp2 protein [Acinetobacter sp. YH12023]|uniref:inovirus-type Gp2 protein n=1 Tax=Acinetobacter sp. YH12023 TaxID=2601041 RepID=UPI0015D21CEA|nr:inovirus-type Gp2 protein [Acinetobacter sp. YH12023]
MEALKLLDHSAGTFTFEEQLALMNSDSSSALIAGEDCIAHTLLRHNTDYEVEICSNILNVIAKCEKAQLPIAKITKTHVFRSTQHYRVEFAAGWDSLVKKIFPAFYYQLSDQYFYGEEIKAWISVRTQFSEKDLEFLTQLFSLDPTNQDSLNKYTDLFNLFIERLIQHMQSSSFRKKIRDRDTIKKNNKKACIELLNHLIAKFAKVLVIRMDFASKRDLATILKQASSMTTPYSRHDLSALKNFMTKFKNNWRNNTLLNDIEGYIFQYEYSQATGFHIHAYFFFDGSKHQEDISIAQYISDYWKKITNNQGSCFICNMKKDQYRYCGIGMIHYSDLEKQSFLIKTFDYICKADQFFIFSELKNFKRFQRSQLPTPKAKSGRARILNSTQSN